MPVTSDQADGKRTLRQQMESFAGVAMPTAAADSDADEPEDEPEPPPYTDTPLDEATLKQKTVKVAASASPASPAPTRARCARAALASRLSGCSSPPRVPRLRSSSCCAKREGWM